MKITCSRCGEEHDLSNISFGSESPTQWDMLSDSERNSSELTQEQCVIETKDGRHFFIRACLDIPIKESDQVFIWGVWCSLSEASFLEMAEHWDDPCREKLGPYFGWLCTKIPEYPDTMFLKAKVHQRAVGERPLVELEQSGHLLSKQQREGIDELRLAEIVLKLLHGDILSDDDSVGSKNDDANQ